MGTPVEVHPARTDDAIVIAGVTRTMLSPSEVAALWGVSVRTVYRMIREGRLALLNLSPGRRGGRGDRYRIAYRTLRELEAAHDDPVPTD